jgi:hypothetical protein
MAKKGKSKSRSSAISKTHSIANRPRLLRPATIRHIVAGIEDRRQFHPLRQFRPPEALKRQDRRIVPSKRQTKYRAVTPFLKFDNPLGVSICAKRQTRKQVLHAMRKTGKAGIGRQRKRLTPFSKIGCK